MNITIGLLKEYQPEKEGFELNFWQLRMPQFDWDDSRSSSDLDLSRTIKLKMYPYLNLQNYLDDKLAQDKYVRTERVTYTYREKAAKEITTDESIIFVLQNLLYDKIINQCDFFKDAVKVEIDIPL